jgi:hypothetical protein
LRTEFDIIKAYLAKEKTPESVRNALERVREATAKRNSEQSTTDVLHVLQEAIRKLTGRVNAQATETNATGPSGTSYAAAAWRGAGAQSCNCSAVNQRNQCRPGTNAN